MICEGVESINYVFRATLPVEVYMISYSGKHFRTCLYNEELLQHWRRKPAVLTGFDQ